MDFVMIGGRENLFFISDISHSLSSISRSGHKKRNTKRTFIFGGGLVRTSQLPGRMRTVYHNIMYYVLWPLPVHYCTGTVPTNWTVSTVPGTTVQYRTWYKYPVPYRYIVPPSGRASGFPCSQTTSERQITVRAH
jgi:hypothetical protein